MRAETSLLPTFTELMAAETPLLRVSRPVAACSRCRSAKIKCDGKLPACTACERANRAQECSSTSDEFAKGKERSYVATLEARVEKLERRLAGERARKKSSIAMHDPESTPATRRASVETVVNRKANAKAMRRKEASDIDELMSDFGLLAVSATARDFYGFTSAMSYARLILSACSREPLPQGMTKLLPPRYEALPLIQHYLDNLFVILPLFDESSFYASVDRVYDPSQNRSTPFDNFSVRMVFAITCLGRSEQRGDTSYSDAVGHVNAALEHAEQVLHPGSIGSVQALVLLVEYSMMDPHHFDSWTLIGAASRAMIDLGMHQDPSRSRSIQRAKLELRRRVFYCVYVLDRSTSLVQTRAFSFSDDSTNVAYPFSPKAGSPKGIENKSRLWLQSYDTALQIFHLRQMQSEWYTELFQSGRTPWDDAYPYIWRKYREMAAWYSDLPVSLAPTNRAFFDLEILFSYVYILSPNPRCPRMSPYAQRLLIEHCIAYATKTHSFISEQPKAIRSILTFYDAIRTYMTGRQFVDVLARNVDILLSNSGLAAARSPSVDMDAPIDPLGPTSDSQPPPMPPAIDLDAPNPNPMLSSQAMRAINAINKFTTVLSHLGIRFGYPNWRDRFQLESAPLLATLHARLKQQELDQIHQAYSSFNAVPVNPHSTTTPPTYSHPMANSYHTPHPFGATMYHHTSAPIQPDWNQVDQMPAPDLMVSQPSVPMAPGSMMELGPGTLAAWETLPGGSLNARFS